MLAITLTAAALVFTPAAHADMPQGNYDFHADWDATHTKLPAYKRCATAQRGATPYSGNVQVEATAIR